MLVIGTFRHRRHRSLCALIAIGVAALLALRPMVGAASIAAASGDGPVLCIGGFILSIDGGAGPSGVDGASTVAIALDPCPAALSDMAREAGTTAAAARASPRERSAPTRISVRAEERWRAMRARAPPG